MKARLLLSILAGVALGPTLPGAHAGRAADLGQLGEVWPIVEPDLWATIKGRLEQAEATGELDRMNAAFAARARSRAMRPPPVARLRPAVEDRSWIYDPSIAVDHDIADLKGNIIARAGQKVNPLDHVEMPRSLIFIDGDVAAEVEWALEQGSDSETMLIMVKGSPFDLMRTRQRRFYFDQQGTLVAKFGIGATPAVVSQEDKHLRVSEVALPGRGS